jgi:hypothetical protein
MPKSNTPKLSDTQLVILSSASQREDGLAVLPEKLKGEAAKAAVGKLTGLGFLKEVRVKREEPAWRADEDEKPIGLKITKAGRAAIGVEDEGDTELEAKGDGEAEPAPEPKARRSRKDREVAPEAKAKPREGSKKGQIIALMQRKGGATLADMVEAIGWLPHTTRAALTGLRQKGYAIQKSKNADGATVYRLDKDAAPQSGAADPA